MKLYNNIMMYYLSDSSTDTAPGGSRDNLEGGGNMSDTTEGVSDVDKCVSDENSEAEEEGLLGEDELENLRVSSPDENWGTIGIILGYYWDMTGLHFWGTTGVPEGNLGVPLGYFKTTTEVLQEFHLGTIGGLLGFHS
ncbi:hypothetical protein ACHWQZ_G004691 [Mnemiopsis leidyi]